MREKNFDEDEEYLIDIFDLKAGFVKIIKLLSSPSSSSSLSA